MGPVLWKLAADTHCLVDRHKGECQVVICRADSLGSPFEDLEEGRSRHEML